MNQILYTIENAESDKRTKNILLFFGIIVIIFGISLIATGGYSFILSQKAKIEALDAKKVPEIALTRDENNQVKINVKHSKQLQAVTYTWNDENEITVTEELSTELETMIDIPAGRNTLVVKAIDGDGKVSTVTQELEYEGTYMDVSIVDNKNVKVVITDVKGLQSVSYKWNSDEEQIKYPSDNEESIEIVLEIPIGLNKLTITAINNDNEVETRERSIQGITGPTLKSNYNSERTIITIILSDNQGIQSYSYKLSYAPIADIAENGVIIENFREKLTLAVSETKEANGELSITEQLEFHEGFNYIEVTVVNVEGVEETLSGWCAK